MEIYYSKQAFKSIKKIPEPYKRKIKSGIENIPNGDIKLLIGFSNMYRLRVGNYRVLYQIIPEGIYIADILPRGSAYQNLQN
ncbi:type II toxin-antitoxin system RelE/ParE family toxin [Clostridiales bacterium COT073_COT-073]|nr:type II toxin-antitoxin system RelE/ParE family toxin [Clostridiales bacterium COT073_COT-073]